jgi:hypothetical protein
MNEEYIQLRDDEIDTLKKIFTGEDTEAMTLALSIISSRNFFKEDFRHLARLYDMMNEHISQLPRMYQWEWSIRNANVKPVLKYSQDHDRDCRALRQRLQTILEMQYEYSFRQWRRHALLKEI